MRIVYMYPEGKFKALTFSFDDGVKQDEKLVQLFNRFGLRGTFNLCTGMHHTTLPRLPLTRENLQKVYANQELACHGEYHATFDQIPRSEVLREVMHDREELEAITDQVITGLAYPNGSFSSTVTDILRAAGIEYARTTLSHNKLRYMPEDFLMWHPTCHYVNALELTPGFLEEKRPLMQLFYIWGHSYELDHNDGWNEMEKLGSLLGGRKDIWYATNIEVCRYIKALRALQFSAGGKRVYNPSAIPVWFQVGWSDDAAKYCVAPGETFNITEDERTL